MTKRNEFSDSPVWRKSISPRPRRVKYLLISQDYVLALSYSHAHTLSLSQTQTHNLCFMLNRASEYNYRICLKIGVVPINSFRRYLV